MEHKIIKTQISDTCWVYNFFPYKQEDGYIYLEDGDYNLFLNFENEFWKVYKSKNGEYGDYGKGKEPSPGLRIEKIEGMKFKNLEEARTQIEGYFFVLKL